MILTRFGFGDKSTLGKMTLGGFSCYSIEDARRLTKIPGVTCIPEGTYPVTLYKAGRFHDLYSKLFPDIHKGMLLLNDVPNYTAVLIHCGNDEDDTEGCICVGAAPLVVKSGGFYVQHSQLTYKSFYPLAARPLVEGKKVNLEVRSQVGPALFAV